MRALVVDDSSAMRALLCLILKKQGFVVLQAKDGQQALSVLADSDPVEVILMDWNMPVMNGMELLTQVRRQSRYSGTRILMVTTETSLQQMSHALAAGANEYIMKPFTADMVHGQAAPGGL